MVRPDTQRRAPKLGKGDLAIQNWGYSDPWRPPAYVQLDGDKHSMRPAAKRAGPHKGHRQCSGAGTQGASCTNTTVQGLTSKFTRGGSRQTKLREGRADGTTSQAPGPGTRPTQWESHCSGPDHQIRNRVAPGGRSTRPVTGSPAARSPCSLRLLPAVAALAPWAWC